MPGYQSVEQLWCKLAASNDVLSQFACYTNFEQTFPPTSGRLERAMIGIIICLVFLWLSYRDGGLLWKKRQ
jgi:hypothetical protein